MTALVGLTAVVLASVQAVSGHLHLGGKAHAHRRMHRHHVRGEGASAITEVVPGPTITVFEFNGHLIPLGEVCQGLQNGTFEWIYGEEDGPDCASYGVTLGSSPASATESGHAQIPQNTQVTESATSVENISQTQASGNAGAQTASVDDTSRYDQKIASNPNVTKEFPDGQIDCSVFPSDYGAIAVDWAGLQGWTGIQYTQANDHVVTHMDTAIQGDRCQNPGNGASAHCSYACPPGYQKSQWPPVQGGDSMAVSVGGLLCGTDGKLHLTNPSLSKSLCIEGTGSVFVKNQLSASNAICRTDYPGTESETVPLVVAKDSGSPLTCPDSATYYKHLGSPTTAEYYVNMKGVPVDEACTWGTDGSSEGNWAPMVFGVGMDQNGKTWLSMQSTKQNNPSTYRELDFTVELQGDFGGSKCFYTKGYYCSKGTPSSFDPRDCQTVNSTAVPGCTVQLMSGNATYVETE